MPAPFEPVKSTNAPLNSVLSLPHFATLSICAVCPEINSLIPVPLLSVNGTNKAKLLAKVLLESIVAAELGLVNRPDEPPDGEGLGDGGGLEPGEGLGVGEGAGAGTDEEGEGEAPGLGDGEGEAVGTAEAALVATTLMVALKLTDPEALTSTVPISHFNVVLFCKDPLLLADALT